MQMTITDYAQLREVLLHWKHGIYPVVILESSPGLGKTTLAKTILQEDPSIAHTIIAGRMSAIRLYESLYEHRDAHIVLDDTDALIGNTDCLELLKALCQVENGDKNIGWHTKATLERHTPKSFSTSSPVLLLTNRWNSQNSQRNALEDRGIHIQFTPNRLAIHTYAQPLIDSEIWAWFDRYLPLIPEEHYSLRPYFHAERLMRANVYWQTNMLSMLGFTQQQQHVIEIDMLYSTLTTEEKLAILTQKYPDVPPRTFARLYEHIDTAH